MRNYMLLFFSLTILSNAYAGTVLHVKKAQTVPKIDGVVDAIWKQTKAIDVKVASIPKGIIDSNKNHQKGKYSKHWKKTNFTSVKSVKLRALYSKDRVYFMAQWKDATKDDRHKPWVWKGTKEDGEYVTGKDREDRIALSFPISGNFTSNMLSKVESVMDVWHWKAARTNSIGISHDKTHIISSMRPTTKSALHYNDKGHEVYVARPGDGGVSPYKRNKIDPFVYKGDTIPRYIAKMPEVPDAIDVSTKGKWQNGLWTVEFSRKLDTGHTTTDTVFNPAKGSKTSIAVFDHVGDHFHATSAVVDIVFDQK